MLSYGLIRYIQLTSDFPFPPGHNCHLKVNGEETSSLISKFLTRIQ